MSGSQIQRRTQHTLGRGRVMHCGSGTRNGFWLETSTAATRAAVRERLDPLLCTVPIQFYCDTLQNSALHKSYNTFSAEHFAFRYRFPGLALSCLHTRDMRSEICPPAGILQKIKACPYKFAGGLLG